MPGLLGVEELVGSAVVSAVEARAGCHREDQPGGVDHTLGGAGIEHERHCGAWREDKGGPHRLLSRSPADRDADPEPANAVIAFADDVYGVSQTTRSEGSATLT
jgi:hypothetical protein